MPPSAPSPLSPPVEWKAAHDERAEHIGGHARPVANSLSVPQAVQAAWSRVLGASSWRLDLSFEQSGGDSLKALELWMAIEQALGQKLQLDALCADTQPSQLARRLAERLLAPVDERQDEDKDQRPLVHFLPGILGDDLAQLELRQAFGKAVRTQLLDYPDWRQLIEQDCSFTAIVDDAFAQMMAQPRRKAYVLAGFSFGGAIAFELARRLLAAGHKVERVFLLDARRWDLVDTPPLWHWDRTLPLSERVSNWAGGSIALLVRRRRYGILSEALRTLTRHAPRLAFRCCHRATRELRLAALGKWQASHVPVPVTLYLSHSRWPGEPAGHGWEDLSASLQVVGVRGNHDNVIRPPRRERIVLHMQAILAAGSRGHAA